MRESQHCDAAAYRAQNVKMLDALRRNNVPATGLVVEGGRCVPRRSVVPEILKMWLDAGAELGNHTYSHPDLNTTTVAAYEADIIRGETALGKALAERSKKIRYFRYPMLHAGRDAVTKEAIQAFLAKRGYTNAPVTIDDQDFVFAEAYAKALDRGDHAGADSIAKSYIEYMDTVFDFFERWSIEVTGREIRQVLLLHDSPLNADHFDELVAMMRKRGYSFVTLDEALADPAYQLPDNYTGPTGLSWLHRWALAKGMTLKQEPREPANITRLARGN
jgi:peptidoglycan/xylan/chitin deacetylase (PgdA/CDA1 family)